jgi:hypothetical protein
LHYAVHSDLDCGRRSLRRLPNAVASTGLQPLPKARVRLRTGSPLRGDTPGRRIRNPSQYAREVRMTFLNIIAIVIAIVVGIFVVKLLFGLLGIVAAIIGTLFYFAIAGAVIYMLYRAFNNMLTNGKRLT